MLDVGLGKIENTGMCFEDRFDCCVGFEGLVGGRRGGWDAHSVRWSAIRI